MEKEKEVKLLREKHEGKWLALWKECPAMGWSAESPWICRHSQSKEGLALALWRAMGKPSHDWDGSEARAWDGKGRPASAKALSDYGQQVAEKSGELGNWERGYFKSWQWSWRAWNGSGPVPGVGRRSGGWSSKRAGISKQGCKAKESSKLLGELAQWEDVEWPDTVWSKASQPKTIDRLRRVAKKNLVSGSGLWDEDEPRRARGFKGWKARRKGLRQWSR